MSIASLLTPTSITVGNLHLTGLRRFGSLFRPLPVPGIYAILVLDPYPFRILYIGESSNLSERVTRNHEKVNHWYREAKGSPLYFAFHSTPEMMTDQQRRDIESQLINQYDPPCNTKGSFWEEVGKLYGSLT
jgi:hypothetical protein